MTDEWAWLFADFELSERNARFQQWNTGAAYDYTTGRPRSGLLYLSACCAHFETVSGALEAPAGTLLFLPQGVRYRVRLTPIGTPPHSTVVNFRVCSETPLPDRLICTESGDTTVWRMERLAQLYRAPDTLPVQFRAELDILLSELALRLRQNARDPLDVIRANPNLPAAEIARRCGISVPTLVRTVRKQSGQSPHQYALSVRFRRACELLRDGAYSVSEISELLGYGSPSAFSAQFSHRFGCTPGGWKRRESGAIEIYSDREKGDVSR